MVAALEALYPPATAEDWDSVGLVAGDPDQPVRTVLLAVDPVEAVLDEAVALGADLVVTHHPLLLRPVHSVAATTAKGALVHRAVRAGVALYNAHTNADAAPGGVAEALARLLGLEATRPLVPSGADPATGIGRVGELGEPLTLRELAQRAADVTPPTAQGVRVAGDLDAPVRTVAVVGGAGDSLFDAVRAAGADVYVTADLRHHPASELRERAVHDARAARDGDGVARPFLVDLAHFASEQPWLDAAAAALVATLADPHGPVADEPGAPFRAGTVGVHVSALSTDPWDARLTRTLDR